MASREADPFEKARARLLHLLDYTLEVSKINATSAGASGADLLQLPSGSFEESGSFVLHEAVLEQMLSVKSDDGTPCCQIGGRRGANGDGDQLSAWLRLHLTTTTCLLQLRLRLL